MNKAAGALALALGLATAVLGVALTYACTFGVLGAFGVAPGSSPQDACEGTIPSDGIYSCIESGYQGVGGLLAILGGMLTAAGLVLLALPTRGSAKHSPMG